MRKLSRIKSAEFVRRIRKLGRKSGSAVHYDARHGKGSHGRVYYGGRVTAIIDLKHEINPGLLHRMCKDLGIAPKDL